MNKNPFIDVLGVKVMKRVVSCHPDAVLTGNFKLIVHVTDGCPGRCKFCCNKSSGFSLDVEKFKRDFIEIEKKCTIDEVFFTGGEPTLYWDKIKECLTVIKQKVTIHTMGMFLDRIDVPINVSLSRHHWDHEENERILGVKLPKNYLSRFKYLDKTNLACNIIKGHVDNEIDMRRVLDLAMDNGIPLVGFIGLMPINDYSKDNGIRIPQFTGNDVLPYRAFCYKKGSCQCSNYCYHRDSKFQLFYFRHNTCPSDNHGGRILYKNGIQPWFSK